MSPRHVVVDGSNLATEGRNLPSLAQLDQAVREFMAEYPDDVVTVVVDASFSHRIDPSELRTFEEAEEAAEVVSPPAGAIGRGDAFLLRIAEKTGAMVLSNDSFQEFHGEHEWLFDKGRLIGGKPVPGVGWIFTPRTPVRGIKSREAVKEAKRKKRGDSDGAAVEEVPTRPRGRVKKMATAIARATAEVTQPDDTRPKRRRRGSVSPSEPINEPLAFITFIAAHPLGGEVQGTVETFSSHGAYIEAENARCYLPLSAMGTPAPRSAREVVNRRDTHTFVVQALDPQRRGIELALPGFAHVAANPTDETVEEITAGAVGSARPDDDEDLGWEEPPEQPLIGAVRRRAASRRQVPAVPGADGAPSVTPPVRARRGRGGAGAPAAEPANTIMVAPSPGGLPATEAPAAGRATSPVAAVKKSPAKAAATKAAATKAAATKAAATKAAATKAAATKAAATKAAATAAKAAGAKKSAVKKSAVQKPAPPSVPEKSAATSVAEKPASRKSTVKKSTTVRKSAEKASTVPKAAVEEAPAKAAAAAKVPRTEAPAGKASTPKRAAAAGRKATSRETVAEETATRKAVPAKRAAKGSAVAGGTEERAAARTEKQGAAGKLVVKKSTATRSAPKKSAAGEPATAGAPMSGAVPPRAPRKAAPQAPKVAAAKGSSKASVAKASTRAPRKRAARSDVSPSQ